MGVDMPCRENGMGQEMNAFAVNDILRLCLYETYTSERLDALWAGRDRLTPEEILDIDIPAEDKIEMLVHLLPRATVVAWLEIIVTRVVANCALNCGHPYVEKWAQGWLAGDDRSSYSADSAEEAAWDEATCEQLKAEDDMAMLLEEASCSAQAAMSAATYSYKGEGGAEWANSAAMSAASSAGDTARVAEQNQQIADLRSVMEKE